VTITLRPPHPTPPTVRSVGWLPIRKRVFLESLAETGIIVQASDDCQISPRAAYTLRLRDEGIGFRLGWEAAMLIARGRLVDTLMERAIKGWDEVITRFADDSDERIRHRIDNRLAMSLLGRLDRRAEPVAHASPGSLARREPRQMRSLQVLESIVMLAQTRPVSSLCLGTVQKI
jgi:hypothetical protein